jgi:hypothetical protein
MNMKQSSKLLESKIRLGLISKSEADSNTRCFMSMFCRVGMENPNPRIGLGSVLIDQIIGPGPLQGMGI